MKEYPLKTNKWGPFFEDIPGWSDTQTNAIKYLPGSISYSTYSDASDIIRLRKKPVTVKCNGIVLKEISNSVSEGYTWESLSTGGILRISHTGKNIEIGL